MNTKCSVRLILSAFLLFTCQCFAAQVQVQGLFKNAAVLMINGKQHMLKVGKRSPEGVLLVYADPKHAIVEIDGVKHDMVLSNRIIGNYKAIENPEVAIPKNSLNQYITTASINGKRTQVLVDTGANSIAMSSKDAARLGIKYKAGEKSQVSTASGVAKAYALQLNRVVLGAIVVNNVDAVVLEGDFPNTILLGMTYLNHVNLREQGGILYLKSKH